MTHIEHLKWDTVGTLCGLSLHWDDFVCAYRTDSNEVVTRVISTAAVTLPVGLLPYCPVCEAIWHLNKLA